MSLAERRALLKEYFEHYSSLSKQNPAALNQKLSRKAFVDMLDVIGGVLLKESADLAKEPGPVRDFLERNPLPPVLSEKLPEDFRVFCLALNALKQWVTAEQAATDRYLLRGTARAECRAVATTCVLSGELLTDFNTDLHHPVRDGRPPIPLSKKAHATIEGQLSGTTHTVSRAANAPTPEHDNGVVRYRSSRLLFRAKVIEPLDDSDKFRIETPEATYEMTKAQFYKTFANAVQSASYRVNGVYSYSRVPVKALPYRVAYALAKE